MLRFFDFVIYCKCGCCSFAYDAETTLYYLQSRYYDPNLGRFINADSYASTGQGILGNNMFAYCRSNPVSRVDAFGRADISAVEESLDDNVEVGPNDKEIGGGGGGNGVSTGTADGNNPAPNGYTVTTGPNGYSAVPNPNNEKTENHHVVEQCQANKSGFSQSDIQGNGNKVDLPYALHRKISGYYSSKPDELGGLRVRDHLAGQSFEQQYKFGWEVIEKFWGEMYGPK